jgi:prepilin-type N-terminal cleavage/methylation domain-containing protein
MIYQRPHKSSKPSLRGFTLIEMLVVVLIIGILAAVALAQYKKAVDRSRITEVVGLAKTFSDMNQIYFLIHGDCPDALDDLDAKIPVNQDRYHLDYNKSNNCLLAITPKGKTYRLIAWGNGPICNGNNKNCIFCNAQDKYAEELCSLVGEFSFLGNPSNTKYYKIR